MRSAQGLLFACLVVGLAVVYTAATAQLRLLEDSLRESERRAVRAELRSEADRRGAELEAALTSGPPLATYARDGTLLRPAPPAVARAFAPAERSLAVVLARSGQTQEAWREARTSAERVAVLLAVGDPASIRKALAEPALMGTDLSYIARLRLHDGVPDAAWVDDVSALVDGPSDRLARRLLADAQAEVVGSREQRAKLAALMPPGDGVFVRSGWLYRSVADGDVLQVRGRALPRFGNGDLRVALAEPYGVLAVLGAVDEARVADAVREQKPRVLLLYGGAAVLLIVGTMYASLSIRRASRLAAEKSDFVANVTHELKTPLANIRMYAESLQADRVKPEDRAEFVGTILEEGRRLESLVESLLHAARGPKMVVRPLDPAALLADAEARWRPRLEREGFSLEAASSSLPAVEGDREALQRALDNLIDNARKYGRRDPRIEIGGASLNGHVHLTVRDHGAGIPAGDRARVLEPFTRLESADRKETSGTGLGLSLVAAAMEAHGGRVQLQNADGGGTVATLVLPVAKENSA